jgi:hypothetical protein
MSRRGRDGRDELPKRVKRKEESGDNCGAPQSRGEVILNCVSFVTVHDAKLITYFGGGGQ